MSDSDDSCPTPFTDHVYKSAHGVDVGLRVWPAEGDKPAPWLYWLHGGGWAGGYHHRMLPWVYPAFHARGYHIVSVGYRLIPHVGREDQIEDLQDAYKWCRESLPTMLNIDLERYVVAGDSAGGYFTSFSPFIFSPPPKALIALYAPTNLVHPKFITPPSPEKVRKEIEEIDYLLPGTQEEVYETYWAERDPSKAMTLIPWWAELEQPIEKIQAQLGLPGYVPGDKEKMLMDLYRWTSAKRIRIPCWLRKENHASREAYTEYSKSSSALYQLDNVTKYPPTFILHGTADTSVPVEQSYAYEQKLKDKGVPVESRYEKGGGHSFDLDIKSPNQQRWKTYINPAMEFVDGHVRK